MNAIAQFNQLGGKTVTRQSLISLKELAYLEGSFEIIIRIDNVLNTHPEAESFDLEVETPVYHIGLGGASTNDLEIFEVKDGYLFSFQGENIAIVNEVGEITFYKEVSDEAKETVQRFIYSSLGAAYQPIIDNTDFANENDSQLGLGKAVTADEIYSTINKLLLNTIEKVGHLPWQKEWKGSGSKGAVRNYVSKKPYTGINFLLNYELAYDENGEPYLVPAVFVNPYFLTFNQITAAKAKLKKGSKARNVIYYTQLFLYRDKNNSTTEIKTPDREKWKNFISENGLTKEDLSKNAAIIPIVKYYNVYRADDCERLKFPAIVEKETTPIEAAQLIIDNYPNPPKFTFIGDEAKYLPKADTVNMPKIGAFNDESFYYSTYFHEIIHSTGHSKRLDRGNDTRLRDGSIEDKKAYAFEELVGELGAVFLCSESGILFHTIENSAKYLKGWNSRLIELMGEDNRAFFKASAKAQKAAYHILDRNTDDVPAYLTSGKKISKKYGKKRDFESKVKEVEKPTRTPKKATNYGKKREHESVKSKYTFSKEDIPYQTAYNAHSGTSFSPEKRAVSEQNAYFQHLEQVFKSNRKKAVALGKLDEFETKFARYKEGYLKRFLEHVRSKIGFFSTMISGPANFPVRRMEKKSNAINAKLNALIDYQKYADFFKSESGIIKTGSGTALSKLEAKLEAAEKNHALILAGNKALKKLRADKNATENDYKVAFINLGFDLATAKKEANYMFKYEYAGFFTTNSSAKIRNLKKQIALEKRLKEKAEVSAENPTEITFDGGSIENDYSDNRIKIFFDSIPDVEIRNFLKKAGQAFKWSPKIKLGNVN